MLVVPKVDGEVQDKHFTDILDYLAPGDVLVLNNTRVTALRLFGQKPTGAAVELLILRSTGTEGKFLALVKPGKRLRVGARIELQEGLVATIVGETEGGVREVAFSPHPRLEEALKRAGQVPLPPYITTRLGDPSRYQTVFAEVPGSSAAPTASLHFTPLMIEEIKSKGIQIAPVTLDVGIDTFRPIESETAEAHKMHGEVCRIGEPSARIINERKGRLIAVGTTAVRTIESFARAGQVQAGETNTKIFITPGYHWQAVDGLLTNFHLPRTTMLMMVAAMIGRERLMGAYAHAIESRYRFLSFGDAMLII